MVLQPSMPSSRWVFNGSHAFSWRTKHACHKPLAEPQPDPGPDPDPPQELPKDPDSNPDGETDTENPPSRSNFKLFLFFWIVVLSVVRPFTRHVSVTQRIILTYNIPTGVWC